MRSTAGAIEAGQVGLHGLLFPDDRERFAEDPGSTGIHRRDDFVVHPLALAARDHDAGAAQVSEVAGDFGLALPEYLDEIADADFPSLHEVEQPQAGAVGEGGKEQSQVVSHWGASHISMIYGLTDMSSENTFALAYTRRRSQWNRL